MKYVKIKEVQYVAHELAKQLMTWDEPIPEFSTRFPTVLERCLAAPQQTYDKQQLYKGVVAKTAILFYVLIKDHPFQNGNKRIAVMTILYFLSKNDKWLRIDNQELYNLARWVAASNPKVKEETVSAIHKIIKEHLVDSRGG